MTKLKKILLGSGIVASLAVILAVGFLVNSHQRKQNEIDLGYSVVSRYQTTLNQSMTSNQTTVPVSSVTTFDDHVLVMADLGDVVFLTIEPGKSREEIVKCTGISGTSWTGCTRGLAFYGTSEVAVAANQNAHNAGSSVVMSNVHYVYDQLTDKDTDQTTSGDWDNSGDWTFSGNVSSTVQLFKYSSDVATCSDNDDICDKEYIDGVAVAGASDANTQTKGIVEMGASDETSQGGPTTSSLLMHLKMNENDTNTTFRDFASSTRPVTIGGITTTADMTVAGKISGALDFDGIGDYATTTAPIQSDFAEATISFWYKRATSYSTETVFKFLFGDTADSTEMTLKDLIGNDSITFRTVTDAGSVTVGAINLDATYHHLVIKMDADVGVFLYVDNVLVNSSAINLGTVYKASTSTTFIGAASSTASFFTGQLDDFRVYDTLLTTDDISFLYNNGEGTEAPLNGNTSAYMCVEIGNYDQYSGAGKVPAANSSGYLDQSWIDLSDTFAWTGVHTWASTATFNATTTHNALTDFATSSYFSISSTPFTGNMSELNNITTLTDGSDADSLHIHNDVTRLLFTTSTDIVIDNTSTETDILSFSIPADALGTDNMLKYKIYYSSAARNGGGNDVVKLKYGATTLVTNTNFLHPTGSNGGYIEGYLFNTGTSGAQVGRLFAEDINNSNSPIIQTGSGTATEDSTGALDFKITFQFTNANASNNITIEDSSLELVKKY